MRKLILEREEGGGEERVAVAKFDVVYRIHRNN